MPQLSEDMSIEEIMKTAAFGDPKYLKVPEKGLMPPERRNTSRWLNQLSADFSSSESDPYYRPSQEDIEDAKRFKNLADRNLSGLLTIKETQQISEILESHNPVTVDLGTERWVETD